MNILLRRRSEFLTSRIKNEPEYHLGYPVSQMETYLIVKIATNKGDIFKYSASFIFSE